MALRVRGFVRIGAAMAGCALVAACTPEPGPTITTTPTPATATPTETDIERQQRLDYEAAEKAYIANMSEQDRQSQLGIAEKTEALVSTSADEYLVFVLRSLREIRAAGWRAEGSTEIVGIARVGWKPSSLHLVSCEDSSKIKFTDRRGRDVTPTGATRTYVQQLTAAKRDGHWVVTDVESKPVGSFEGAVCAS